MNNAEEVAIGVLKNDKIITRVICLRMTFSSYPQKPFYFTLLVSCIEVKVKLVSTHEPLRNLIQRQVYISFIGILKNHPAATSRHSRDIMKSFLPKRQHLIEVNTINDNGANP